MANLFGEYAEYYDLLYRDKDYAREVAFIVQLLDKWIHKTANQINILDLACGTGRHAQELSLLGYHVDGSDISGDMITLAKERAKSLKLDIRYYNESFQTCDQISGDYDVVLINFSAINYLTAYSDFSKTMRNIHKLLRKGGILVFDFWNGNAVIKDYSPTRVKRVNGEGRELIRISNTSLDPIAQIATVTFDFILMDAGRLLREFFEVHPIRYFFPQEMVDLLLANRFELVHRCPFLNFGGLIQATDWNLTYVTHPCA